MSSKKEIDMCDKLCSHVNSKLHEFDNECGYRHYAVILRTTGSSDWKGKDCLRNEL